MTYLVDPDVGHLLSMSSSYSSKRIKLIFCSMQFHQWGCLDLAKLIEGFYLLFTYYVNECSSGKAGQGAFAIHPDLKQLFCELLPENLPYNSCPPPGEIVEYLKMSEEREKSVNMMTIREKAELYSPTTYPSYTTSSLPRGMGPKSKFGLSSSELLQEAVLSSTSNCLAPPSSHTFHHHSSSFNFTTELPDHNTTFSFDRSLDEFGLSTITRFIQL